MRFAIILFSFLLGSDMALSATTWYGRCGGSYRNHAGQTIKCERYQRPKCLRVTYTSNEKCQCEAAAKCGRGPVSLPGQVSGNMRPHRKVKCSATLHMRRWENKCWRVGSYKDCKKFWGYANKRGSAEHSSAQICANNKCHIDRCNACYRKVINSQSKHGWKMLGFGNRNCSPAG